MKYEFTITFRPLLYKYTSQEQSQMVRQQLRKAFETFEVSAVFELTGEDNIHVHALIDLADHRHRARLLNRFRSITYVGRKTCTPVRDEPAYRAYLIKDLARTRDLGVDPVIQDSYEILGNLQNITTYCPQVFSLSGL